MSVLKDRFLEILYKGVEKNSSLDNYIPNMGEFIKLNNLGVQWDPNEDYLLLCEAELGESKEFVPLNKNNAEELSNYDTLIVNLQPNNHLKSLCMNDGTRLQYNYLKNVLSYYVKSEKNVKPRYIIMHKYDLDRDLAIKSIDDIALEYEEYSSADYL